MTAQVEGDIAEVDGVLRITEIRLQFRVRVADDSREAANRALANYADKCPAYQSVKECIQCSWQVEYLDA